MSNETIIILGAGIAGLAYGMEARCRGHNVVVLEKKPFAGGLCHSFCIEGFTFDTAVHFSFTEKPGAKEFFSCTDTISHKPESYNFYYGKWLRHPFINNLAPLSSTEKTECILSYLNKKEMTAPDNYWEWLKASYGELFAERFYGVYTKKYWTVDAKKLGINWVGNRLGDSNLEKIISGSYETCDRNDYYAKEMRYPVNGGYESFLQPLIKGNNTHYNATIKCIRPIEKEIELEDGGVLKYDRLVSSLPLPELVKYLGRDYEKKMANDLPYLKASKISLVSIAFNKPDIPRYLWQYVYDEDIWAARIYSPSMKSANNAPKDCSSLQFEIYHNPDEKVPSKDEILENVIYSLKKMKLATEEDILFMDYRLVEYGNVIFLKNMEEHRDSIKEQIEKLGISLIGRFGEWEYFWSDQSYLSGKCRAEKDLGH